MAKNIHLIMIDPQRDFCDPAGSLFVPGADKDMLRLAQFIRTNGNKFADIHCTLDSHQTIHIAHPIFWKDSNDKHPAPFTTITVDEVRAGKWKTTNPSLLNKGLHYVEELAKHNRYQLMIWPPHCRIGTLGHALVGDIADALCEWEAKYFAKVNFVAKGSNFFTEHYSAVQADVPDDSDNTTRLNTDLLDILKQADEILITGEALSHCVANTITDVANNFGDENIKKFVLLRDTTSNVPNCDSMGDKFIKELTARGMQVTTTKDY